MSNKRKKGITCRYLFGWLIEYNDIFSLDVRRQFVCLFPVATCRYPFVMSRVKLLTDCLRSDLFPLVKLHKIDESLKSELLRGVDD